MKNKGKLQRKMMNGLLLVSIVLVVAITTFVAKFYRNKMEDYYSSLALEAIEYVSREIDVKDIQKYYETGEKDAHYEELHTRLNNIVEAFHLDSIYIMIPHGDTYTYIIDGTDYDDPSCAELGEEDIFYGDAQERFDKMWQGGPSTVAISNSEEYGYLASVGAALKDESGQPVAAVCADISMNMINSQIRSMVINSVIVAFMVIFISIALYFIYIRKIVVRPIDKLAQAAAEFPDSEDEEGNLQVTTVTHNGKDEIGELYDSIIEMENSIVTYMKNLKQVTAEKERIGVELNVATEIQANMLPSIFPPFPNLAEFDIFATMDPAKEVGGDFYDFFLADENHIALVMADVSGKGVPAALFMVIAKTLIKNRTQMGGSPAEILQFVNGQLCEGNEAGMFVTVWLAIIDIKTGKGVASNAGHEYPVVKRKDGAFELIKNRHSPALAVMEGIRFREIPFELYPGDRLFVYTDGVPEATNVHDEQFGTDRLLESLNKRKDADVKEILYGLKEDLDAFVGEADQFDDVTMLGFDYFGEKEV